MEATQTVALRAAADDCAAPRRDDAVMGERTIPRLFIATSRARSSQVAMRWKRRGIWEAITWADYAAAVRGVGCALVAFGLQRGDRVAILSDNRPEWLFADLGAEVIKFEDPDAPGMTALTRWLCPGRLRTIRRPGTSQSRAIGEYEAVSRSRPPGPKAICGTSPSCKSSPPARETSPNRRRAASPFASMSP